MKTSRLILIACVLIGITAVAFTPSLRNGFTNWDDTAYVTDNLLIRSLSPENLSKIFTTFQLGFYHPLTLLSYACEYVCAGPNPQVYHATNLILHIMNTFLVFWFIYLLSGNQTAACITALLFGIHPLHVESVAWISERKDVLSTLFILAALIAYIRYRTVGTRGTYLLTLALFTSSFLAKPMGVAVPFVMLLCDYLLNERFQRKIIVEKIPFLAIALFFALLAIIAQEKFGAVKHESSFLSWNNISVACYGFLFYIGKIILPLKLSCIYPYPDKIGGAYPPFILLSPFFAALLTIAVLAAGRHSKKLVFGYFFFLITLAPVLQLVPISLSMTADRYTYIPSIGLFYLGGEGFIFLWNRFSRTRYLLAAAGIIIACVLALLTFQRCRIWQNSITLWDDVLAKYPRVASAYNNRGYAIASAGNIEGAIADYTEAIRIDPAYAEAYSNRGNAYGARGDFEKAIADYNEAIRLQPQYAAAYTNRGHAYAAQRDFDRAIADYDTSLGIDPRNQITYNNRGFILFLKGDLDGAIADYTSAISIDPYYFKAYNNRGIAYAAKGELTTALTDFNAALKLNPYFAQTYYHRAIVYYTQGNIPAAWNDAQRAQSLGFPVNAELVEKLRNTLEKQPQNRETPIRDLQ